MGPFARLVPTDFAVGWGPMSDSAVLQGIEISQANRFYFWRTNSWPLSREQIEMHSANWHVIPGSEAVRSTLDHLRVGSVIELQGQLVDIEGQEGGMTTSLSRRDTGPGACEILLASSARVLERQMTNAIWIAGCRRHRCRAARRVWRAHVLRVLRG